MVVDAREVKTTVDLETSCGVHVGERVGNARKTLDKFDPEFRRTGLRLGTLSRLHLVDSMLRHVGLGPRFSSKAFPCPHLDP